MPKPSFEQLGANIFAFHVHGKESEGHHSGEPDGLSADLVEGLQNHNCGRLEVDGIKLEFMGGIVPSVEKNHDGVPGKVGIDGLLVRKKR